MSTTRECIICKSSAHETPVTKFYHKDTHFYICSQHIPILIHNPQELVGLLDGADQLQGG